MLPFHTSLGYILFCFLGNNSPTANGSFGFHQERHGHPREKWICKSESREWGDKTLNLLLRIKM